MEHNPEIFKDHPEIGRLELEYQLVKKFRELNKQEDSSMDEIKEFLKLYETLELLDNDAPPKATVVPLPITKLSEIQKKAISCNRTPFSNPHSQGRRPTRQIANDGSLPFRPAPYRKRGLLRGVQGRSEGRLWRICKFKQPNILPG